MKTVKLFLRPSKGNYWWIKLWKMNGKPYREDGPAVYYPDGSLLWCLNGKRYKTNFNGIIDDEEAYDNQP